ncbi:MAG: insulinase family protein [candidate division NC10 bacterium]|nr:insulinase family protein [candidate division NC10 bacterium]
MRELRGGRGSAIALTLGLLFVLPGTGASVEVLERTLENGLKVLLVEEHKAPVATFHVWYRVGSRNERLGATGVSHFLEHMMFKGTPSTGPKEFTRIIQRNGGWDNAFTGHDYTGYYTNIAADRIHLPVTLEADRMANLLVKEEDVRTERDVVLEERRLRTEDDPSSAVVEEMYAAAFKAHPYGNPIIGWMEEIHRITREELLQHYRAYYAPNNALVVAVGAFNREALFARIREAFGRIPRGPAPPAVRSVEPPQQGERRVVVKREAQLPFIVAGYHTPTLTHPDSFALEVLASVLADGKSSRLHRSLVYEQQVALYAGASYARLTADPYLFYLYAAPLPGKGSDQVERAVYAEVERLQREAVGERELQKAKNQLEADFILSQDSIFSLARQIATYEMVASWRDWERYLPGIRAVTAADVQRVARTYLTADNRTVGVLVPLAMKE